LEVREVELNKADRDQLIELVTHLAYYLDDERLGLASEFIVELTHAKLNEKKEQLQALIEEEVAWKK
jgi:hypothetical protein